MPAGRPSGFTQEIADQICERIAEGESVRTIIETDGMPSQSMIYRWLSENQSFREQYAHAREMQADTLFDEMLDIADDGTNDWMLQQRGENEVWVENGEALRRSQLRIDTRKWIASKLKPKKYGDKLDLNHGVTEEMAEVMKRLRSRE